MAKRETQWWHEMPERYEETAVPALVVFSAEPVNTGLLDESGNPIMRNPVQIGFLRGPS